MEFLINIAEACMPFLYFLRDIGNPVFDFFFELITHIGEETVFLVISIVFFWCVNKREGYYILLSGLFGTLINQWAKLACRVPRPWDLVDDFLPIGNSMKEATGYSFPSGHTQNIAGTLGSVCAFFKRNWVRITAIVIIALVSFSRMYLGVHTPADVFTSLGIALVLVLALYPVFSTEERFNKCMPYVVGVSVALTLAFFIFVNLLNPADYVADITVGADGTVHDPLASALKNGATLLGCMLGLVVVYPLDRLVIRFETGARWYSQLIKLVIGLALVLLIKEGLRTPLELLVGVFTPEPTFIARAIRYFFVVLFAGAVWPLTFKFFAKLRISVMERLTDKLNAAFHKN